LAALFVAVLVTTVLAADAWSRRVVLAAAAIAALAGVALVLVIAQGNSLREATSGRSDLVANTTEVIRENPIVGVGIGAEREASARRAREAGDRLPKASHTAVLTVAAELGAIGVGLFLAFLVGAVALFAAARARDAALGLGLGGVFLVVFVHSISYSGFFEDPLMWGTLGVAAAAASQRRATETETGATPERTIARLFPRVRRSTPASP
ncbi:MAG: O-antigen ligase family protein, partial [Actinobacteria bacterium]|nr:O-antigen ligase family protein [Actinomycetota bacterium]